MINSVVLVGRAGGDPDVKTFQSGAKVASINMALNRPKKEKDDKQVTDWFQVKFWGKSAEIAEKFVKKGHLFGVQGELQQETWEDNGQKRSKVVVIGRGLELMEKKGESSSSSLESSVSDGGAYGGGESQEAEDIFAGCDDIPF